MATTLDLCGIMSQSPKKASRFQPILRQQNLPFSVSIHPWKPQLVAHRVSCEAGKIEPIGKDDDNGYQPSEKIENELTCVMKFGGSSVASADKMREVAELILSFPEERPVVVLSAMGKTTNNLLKAGEKAVTCGVENVAAIEELACVKDLHLRTVDELGVEGSIISKHLSELEQLLNGIAMMKEMTSRTKDYLVSFGECMSTRIFAAYLNKAGVKARQYDAFEIGFTTTDDFTNADILEATYPAVAKRLRGDWISDPAIPIVTGFLGKGYKTCAVTTLGRGGSDLTAITIGKALGLRAIQVWKDVDGVLTCYPDIDPYAEPAPFLTFDEAAELAYFGAQVLHPQSMRPARGGDIPVRVNNSYNPKAPETLITQGRDMIQELLTSFVFKLTLKMLDIVSTRMLGQFGFLAKVFSILVYLGISHVDMSLTLDSSKHLGGVRISVDVVGTKGVRFSSTLDTSQLWSRVLQWSSIFSKYALEIVRKLASQFAKLLENYVKERSDRRERERDLEKQEREREV